MKNHVLVTGGAGYIGSNLIEFLILKTKNNIISLDNYSSGKTKNHIKSNRIKYINGNTKNIDKILKRYSNKIKVVFHFGEFARIHQSFLNLDECLKSNVEGTGSVIRFCIKNKIKLIYSATSASLGNKGQDQNLSPYAFTKSKNLKLLIHLDKKFNLDYEILYFYNVYGKNHISQGNMATVIGIFENQYKKNKPITVTKPGNQKRIFTHIDETVKGCFHVWKENKNRHYALSGNTQHTILQIAKFFKHKIKFINKRLGERKKSTKPKMIGSIKINFIKCNKSIREYINEFRINNPK